MSREADSASRALTFLEHVLAFTTNGTADRPRRIRKLDLAVEHMHAWRSERMPADGERGGSSSPREAEDRWDAFLLDRMVARDLRLVAELTRTIEHAARELYSLMLRNVETLDPAKLPKEAMPGCVSCARAEQKGTVKIGGHFAPVMPATREGAIRGNRDAHAAGLCRWCFDVKEATGSLPLVDECDVYHREGPRAAGLLRAKRERRTA